MRRAVVMVIDGLRADMVGREYTPRLAEIVDRSRWFTEQRSVFPSATRVNSASIGHFTNSVTTSLTHYVSGLASNTTYYFAFRMTNCAEETWAQSSEQFETQGETPLGIDNLPGSVPLEHTALPEACVLLFGQEGPGLSAVARDAASSVCSIAQFGSTRSINAGVAAGIAMHAWVRRWAD